MSLENQPDCAGSGSMNEPADALGGLCPVSLMGVAMQTMASWYETPQSKRWVAPEPAKLEGLIPGIEPIELIGRGGMGAVYKAVHHRLDREVALKLIYCRDDDPPQARERIGREATTLASLDHPALVRVYDAGVAEPWHYMVMEYVHGASLAELMRFGTPPPAVMLAIAARIAKALVVVHEAGLIHRDVKPSNIMLREGWLARCLSGELTESPSEGNGVLLVDFGIAKPQCPDPAETRITERNHVLGTPYYLAPEQANPDEAVDARADQYALGATLYQGLTGKLPIGQADPPSVFATLDPRIDQLVMRCLAQNPDRRFDDSGHLAEELHQLADSATTQLSTPAKTTKMWRPLVAAGLGLAVGAVVTALVIHPGTGSKSPQLANNEQDAAQSEPIPSVDDASDVDANPPETDTAAVEVAPPTEPTIPDDPITLSNLRISRDAGRYLVRVDYQFNESIPHTHRLRLVVESASGERETYDPVAFPWRDRGSLRVHMMLIRLSRWPVECYLEESLIGTLDDGVRVSNTLTVDRTDVW